jgi:hypothetical protein
MKKKTARGRTKKIGDLRPRANRAGTVKGGIVVNGNAASVSRRPGPGAVSLPYIEQRS